MPFTGSLGGFAVQLAKARGSLDRASAATARDLARRPVHELTALLRDNAEVTIKAPGVGADGAAGGRRASTCGTAPGRSGCPTTWTWTSWRMLLDWLPPRVPGLVPRRRLAGAPPRGHRRRSRSWGRGGRRSADRVRPLAMAAVGRAVALADLGGPACRRAAGPTAPRRLRSALRWPERSACDTQHAGIRCAHVGPRRGGPAQRRCSRSTGRSRSSRCWRATARPASPRSPGELGVHKSTAFRLVVTLEAHRLVEQVGDRGSYRLGVGILRLAGATTARLDLVRRRDRSAASSPPTPARPSTSPCCSESSALYLDQVAGSSALQPHNWVGQHIPLHATSNGKVLLSELDRAELKAAVPASCRAFTDHDDHDPPPSCATSWPRSASRVRRRGRRARDRADRRRGADPQRARRRHRLDEHLRPDVPARRRTPGRGGPPAGRRRRRGLPPARLGPAHLSRGPSLG